MSSLNSITHWDEEADVVILGFGLAGAITAITAKDTDRSADVLIVEKNPEHLAGGNSRASGQTLFLPHDREKLMNYQQALNQPNPIPEDLLGAWADERMQQEPWVERMAAEVGMEYVRHGRVVQGTVMGQQDTGPKAEFPDMPGSEVVKYLSTIEPHPSGVWFTFKKHVDKRPIRTMYETAAFDLVQDPDSLEVYGVRARRGGREIAIKARRAVVMAVGSHENNAQMQRDYFGFGDIYPTGNPANTGDGLKMLQKAGADMWHLRNQNQSGGIWPCLKAPGYESVFFRNFVMTSGSWLEVGKDSQRFYNEGYRYASTHYRMKRHGYWVDTPHAWVLPVHLIFDETTRTQDCLITDWLGWSAVVLGYKWSADNSEELKKGWFTKANSISELARLIDREPAELEATVQRYNEAAKTGNDPEFGRAASTMAPLITPPFYAAEIVAGIVCTTGGAKRDTQSRVVDVDGRPIPRLYEVGELGSTIANLYQNGSFLTECIAFGRIAGRNVVAEKAWAAAAPS